MRLIDADALLNEFLKRYTERERNRNLVFAACEIKQDFADMISDFPTVDAASGAAERRMIMPKNVVCKKCNNLVNGWCEKMIDSPDPDMQRDCRYFCEKTNAQKIRAMSDEELSEFLTHMNPTNCQDCAFSHEWRCQPDRDDYSDFEKCKEGRKRWLKQPAKGE